MLTRIHWKYLSYWNKKCQRPNQETKPPATHTGQVLLGSASDQIPSVQNLGVLQRVFLFQGPIPSGSVNHPTTRQAYSAKTSAFSRSYTVIGPFSTAFVNLKTITCLKARVTCPALKQKVCDGPHPGEASERWCLHTPTSISPVSFLPAWLRMMLRWGKCGEGAQYTLEKWLGNRNWRPQKPTPT